MNTRRIDVCECKKGDMLAESIFNENGTLMVSENTIINDHLKQRLADMNLEQVLVYEENKTQEHFGGIARYTYCSNREFEKFIKTYENKVYQAKIVLDDICKYDNNVYCKINDFTSSLINETNLNSKVIEYIYQLKSKDGYTYIHSTNVAVYAMMLGRWLKLEEEYIKHIATAAILHDIGKFKVPNYILNKRAGLLPSEQEQLKNHTIYGYNVLKEVDELDEGIRQAVLLHHEREDGSGYPAAIKGVRIDLCTKILAAADMYDIMITQGIQEGNTPFDVFREFEKVGFGHFDTNVIMTMFYRLSTCYVGMNVTLNNGEHGKVIAVLPQDISNPIIQVGSKIINLANEKSLKIENLLSRVS